MSKFYTSIEKTKKYLLVRGYENGKRFEERVDFNPVLYMRTQEESIFKDFTGKKNLEPIQFESMAKATEFIYDYSDVENFDYYGMEEYVYQYIAREYPDEIVYDKNLIKVCYIDIEVLSDEGFPNIWRANKPITAITVYDGQKYHLFAFKDFKTDRKDIVFYRHDTEKEMLANFIEFFRKQDFDVISGWFSEEFDIPYIINRCNRVLGEEKTRRMSPWNVIQEIIIRKGEKKETQIFRIFGISQLDYFHLYKRYGKPRESYKLGYVAHLECGVSKISYDDYSTLSQLYEENPQLYFEYNIRDVELIPLLNEELKYLELVYTIAYSSKALFIDVFKQTRLWDSIIYNFLLKKNKIIPRKRRNSSDGDYVGGFVKDPNPPGMFKWVISLDLTSMYPHIYMNSNISPDTYVDKLDLDMENLVKGLPHGYEEFLKENNYAMAGNGTLYRKDFYGFLPELLDEMFLRRKQFKDKKIEYAKMAKIETDEEKKKDYLNQEKIYDAYQSAIKVCLNACYGATGNAGFRFFSFDQAEAITISGQHILRWGERRVNEYMNKIMKTEEEDYVIYMDTDSLMVNFGEFVKKYGIEEKLNGDKDRIADFFLKFYEEKLKKVISDAYDELAVYMNSYEQRMNMKMEKICDTYILAAKKRYIMSIIDNEQVRMATPEISVTGIEAVRSSVPEKARDALKEAFTVMIRQDCDALRKYVDNFREEFKKTNIEEIAFPRGVSNIEKFQSSNQIYIKGTPIHARASLLYNHYLKQNDLMHKYEPIRSGEKMKFIYLKMPNPIHENVIAFINKFPGEFGLEDYIDYDEQFDKVFFRPLDIIAQTVGWDISGKNTLESFFQ